MDFFLNAIFERTLVSTRNALNFNITSICEKKWVEIILESEE